MGNVRILDCTLRDGGYINNWNFGKDAIDFTLKKLVESNIDIIEVGFIKGDVFDENRTVYPDCESIREVIAPKSPKTQYVGMVDMSAPVPLERIPERTDADVDLIRVIFKQDKLQNGLEYISRIKEKGYLVMAQLVSTDTYTDEELIDAIKQLNRIGPYAVYLVDSLGIIKNNEFLRLIYLMDHHLAQDIILGYHSHNNLQQAMGNAVSFVNMNLRRDIIIDACIFGMGRGAGNLNEELFAEYLNETRGTNYVIEPLLEAIDEYLGDISKTNFWGYSLPFYLTAKNRVHPNYGKYYNAKATLTEKAFDDLLKTIAPEDTHIYSAAKAEKYYLDFMKKPYDDRANLEKLSAAIKGKPVIVFCPGSTLRTHKGMISETIANTPDSVKIAVAFDPEYFDVDYVFCCNMKRYKGVKKTKKPLIITSNISTDPADGTYILQYSSFISSGSLTYDNAGLMALNFVISLEPSKIYIAGMDGYTDMSQLDANRDVSDSDDYYVGEFNSQMRKEIQELRRKAELSFITPSIYEEERIEGKDRFIGP